MDWLVTETALQRLRAPCGLMNRRHLPLFRKVECRAVWAAVYREPDQAFRLPRFEFTPAESSISDVCLMAGHLVK